MQRRFSTYHLTSAAHNARIAGEAEEAIESQGRDGEFRNESLRRWQPIHDAHVVTTFIESFASVEAAVNEHLSRPQCRGGSEISQFADNYPGDLIEEKSTLPKVQLVLRLSGGGEFETGETPYQDIELLRKLRNHFVHHEHKRASDSILGGLETKNVDENPFAGGGVGQLDNYLSYECAIWSFDSSIEFLNEFYDRINVNRPCSAYQDTLRAEAETGWIEQEPQW